MVENKNSPDWGKIPGSGSVKNESGSTTRFPDTPFAQAAMAKKEKDKADREKQKTQQEDRKKKAQASSLLDATVPTIFWYKSPN